MQWSCGRTLCTYRRQESLEEAVARVHLEVSPCHQSFFLFIDDPFGHIRTIITILKLDKFSYTSLHDDKECCLCCRSDYNSL